MYTTFSLDKTRCVVKILNPATEEKAIYERLLRLDCASPNHTVPCDLSKEGHPLLIMPSLSDFIFLGPRQWSLWDLLGIFLQLVEVSGSVLGHIIVRV